MTLSPSSTIEWKTLDSVSAKAMFVRKEKMRALVKKKEEERKYNNGDSNGEDLIDNSNENNTRNSKSERIV